MGQMKPWQLVLIVVAALVFAGSIAYTMFGGQKIRMGTRIELVDLVTGDRWWIDVSGNKRGTFPAKHPETGERTLARIHEEDDGWRVDGNDIAAVVTFVDRSKLTAVESFDQGTVNFSDASEKQYRPGG